MNEVSIAPSSGTKAGMVGFRKSTGDIVWASKPFPGKIGYASPMITAIGGVDQVLIDTTTAILGVDAGNGDILWESREWGCMIPIVSPCHLGDGKVFVSGGYFAGAILLQVDKVGDSFTARPLFKTAECRGQVHQPILHKGHLYLNGNDTSKEDGMICMDLEGNIKWRTERDPGFYFGGLLLADGMIYVVDGDTGDLCLVRPDPAGYQEVSRARLLGGEKIWGTLAMSDGRLLIRDQSQLKCIDVRAP